jgi:thiamine-phosphate pyrophosphorylase
MIDLRHSRSRRFSHGGKHGKSRMVDFKLYLITSRMLCYPAPLEKIVREACDAGIRAVQLREKDLSGKALYEEACTLRETTKRNGANLLVNDRLDIALATDADGIHCPENGLPISTARRLCPDKTIGASVHSLESAAEARNDGAHFIVFGPIFPTPSKAAYGPPQGLDALSTVCRQTGIPVFAVGGVSPENALLCLENGAAGVAVVSAVMSAENITRAVKQFERALGGL